MGMLAGQTENIIIGGEALSLITDGFVTVILEEEIIEPEEPEVDPRLSGGGVPDDTWEARQRKKKKKKITAKVYIGGEEFKETVIVEDLTLELKDVRLNVSLDENQKPKLKIILPEGYTS